MIKPKTKTRTKLPLSFGRRAVPQKILPRLFLRKTMQKTKKPKTKKKTKLPLSFGRRGALRKIFPFLNPKDNNEKTQNQNENQTSVELRQRGSPAKNSSASFSE